MVAGKVVKVGDLMNENIISVENNALVIKAVRTMIEHEIGSVVVTRDGVPEGIVTELDYYQKVCCKLDRNCSAVSVEEIMSTPLITVESDSIPAKAAQLMYDHNIHHLLVTREETIVGIITQTDLLIKMNKLFIGSATNIVDVDFVQWPRSFKRHCRSRTSDASGLPLEGRDLFLGSKKATA